MKMGITARGKAGIAFLLLGLLALVPQGIAGVSMKVHPAALRHGLALPSTNRLNLLLVTTTDVTDSVEAALQEHGFGYDRVHETQDWSTIDFSPYEAVIFAVADCAIGEASLQAVREQVIDQGKRAIFIGGSASTQFAQAVDVSLLDVNSTDVAWATPSAPHWRLQLPQHPLARALPNDYTFSNSNASRYCMRITDSEAVAVAVNGDGQPCLVKKSTYPSGGDLIWFINDPSQTAWSVSADYQLLSQIIANALSSQNSCDLLVLHTTSIDLSVFRALDELGYVYTSVLTADWSGIDLSAYDMVIAALDGGAVGNDGMLQLKEQVVATNHRLMIIGGVASRDYALAIHTLFFACEAALFSWLTSPTPHLSVFNDSHFLANELPTTYNFTNSQAATFQLKVRDGRIDGVARNGLSETILFAANYYGAGDVVYFSYSPRSSHWQNQNDFSIFKQIIANSMKCGASAACSTALISDQTQFDSIVSAVNSMGLSSVDYTNNAQQLYTADAELLNQYQVILWYKYDRLMTQQEFDVLESWVENGGRLFVTGFDSLGSPSDERLRSLIRSATSGDGPFDAFFDITTSTHPIVNGPYGSWSGGTTLRAGHSDNDYAIADSARGAIGVASLSEGAHKIIATENIGGGGKVVYWNGNLDCLDWTDQYARPHCTKLLKNALWWLCSFPTPSPTPTALPTPPGVPAHSSSSILILVAMMSCVIAIVRKR